MTKVLRWAVVAAIALTPALSAITAAHADVANSASSTNVQEGDNKSSSNQSGTSKSGDAVGGQVTGVVSSGRASVDATNKSDHVDVSTGDSRGQNNANAFVGLNSSTSTAVGVGFADTLNTAPTTNLQEGSNKYDLNQTLTSTSGDGVGGQVIGVVTSGGSASIVAANTSTNIDIETGDARAFNDAAAFVGLESASDTTIANPFAADVLNAASATNVQEGDNKIDASQTATAASGDGVGGQVLGVVSAGAASVDATNKSDTVDISTGDARSGNDFASFDGLNDSTSTIVAADVLNGEPVSNLQEGSNKRDLMQNASAMSGDAVAGEVAGVVTSAGGSADLVLANTSTNSDTDSGDGRFFNTDSSFTGLNVSPGISV